MRCRCQVLLFTLLLAGWTWGAQSTAEQFGWGRKDREARVALNQRAELATQTPAVTLQSTGQSYLNPWQQQQQQQLQQPVSVSINPPRPAPTPVRPLPPLPPAPSTYTLPNVGGGVGFHAPNKAATGGSSTSSSSGDVDGMQGQGMQGQSSGLQTQQAWQGQQRWQGQSNGLQGLQTQKNGLQGWQGQSKMAAGLDSSSSQQLQPGRMQMLAGQGSMQLGQGQQQHLAGSGANPSNWGFANIPPGSTVVDVTEIPPVDWSSSDSPAQPWMGAGSTAVGSGSSGGSSDSAVSSSNSIVLGPGVPSSEGVGMPISTGSSSSGSSGSGSSVVGGNNGMMAPPTAGGNTGLPVSSSSGGSNGGSSGSSGLPANGVIGQTPGTTVQVLTGRPGSVNTITSGQGQSVTIISIMPAGSSSSSSSGSGNGNGNGIDFSGGGSGAGPVTIWSSNGNQQQLQQMLSNPAAARSKGTAQQQILPALPTEGLGDEGADAGGGSLKQAGGVTGSVTPDFMLGTETREAPVPDVKQGSLKPSFGGPGDKGRYGSKAKNQNNNSSGSSSKQKSLKRPPFMIPVDGGSAGGLLLQQDGQHQQQQQQQQQESPWNQQQKKKGTAPKPRNTQTAKTCGCPDFSFNFACGSDGVTYANPCMASCAGAWVTYMGPCEPTWSAVPKGSSVKGTVMPGGSSGSSGGSSGSLEMQLPPMGQKAAEVDSAAAAELAGDYEYYYDDGRPPVPAPHKPHQSAGSPSAAPLPPALVPVPIPVTPLPPSPPQDGTEEEPYEDEIDQGDGGSGVVGAQPQPMQPLPPGLPQVFGPEPIPEDEPQIPVPAPMPVALTSPAPKKDTKGMQDKVPIPRAPVRVPPPAPPPAPARSTVRPPAPQQSALPDVAGVHAGHVQAPKPWVLKQEGASKTILIGCMLPFEGDLQIAGTSIYHALKLAVSDEAPKVLPNFNINVTCINTKCADIAAHMAMSRFAKEKAVAVVGEVCSAATVAAAGVSSSSKVPLISPAATSPALSGEDLFFRTVPSDKFQGQAAANLLIKKGYRNVAMVYEDAAYGYGLAFNFMASFTKDGGNVPVVVMFKKGQGKPKQDVLQVKGDIDDRNLDAVFLATNNLTYAAGFVRAAANNDLGLKIFGGDALADTMMVNLLQDQPDALKDLSVTTVNKGKNPFIKKFRAAFPAVTYGSFAAQAYDAMVALLRAYAAARPPRDGPELAKELRKQKFEGVSGPIAFDSSGDAIPHNRTYMWVKHNTTTGVPTVKGYISRMV